VFKTVIFLTNTLSDTVDVVYLMLISNIFKKAYKIHIVV
jgi:hypothetical protein